MTPELRQRIDEHHASARQILWRVLSTIDSIAKQEQPGSPIISIANLIMSQQEVQQWCGDDKEIELARRVAAKLVTN